MHMLIYILLKHNHWRYNLECSVHVPSLGWLTQHSLSLSTAQKPVHLLACGDVEGKFDALRTEFRQLRRKVGTLACCRVEGIVLTLPEIQSRRGFKTGSKQAPIRISVLGAENQETVNYP